MEKIPKYYNIKDSDKQEGISMYGAKPLGDGENATQTPPEGIKTSKDLAAEGNIAWDKDKAELETAKSPGETQGSMERKNVGFSKENVSETSGTGAEINYEFVKDERAREREGANVNINITNNPKFENNPAFNQTANPNINIEANPKNEINIGGGFAAGGAGEAPWPGGGAPQQKESEVNKESYPEEKKPEEPEVQKTPEEPVTKPEEKLPVPPEKPPEAEKPLEATAEKKDTLAAEQKIRAAEILCLADSSTKKEDYEKIIKELEKKYPPEIIKQAYKTASARLDVDAIYAKAVELQKTTHRDKSVVDILKEFQRESKGEYDLYLAANTHKKALIDLKRMMFENETKNLEKEFGVGDPRVFKKLYEGGMDFAELGLFGGALREKHKDISYEFFTRRLMITEIKRMNESAAKAMSELEPRSEGVPMRMLRKFGKIPRGWRTVIGSVVTGGAIAAFSPAMMFAAVPMFIGARVFRGLTGAALAGGLQKLFGNRIVNRAYENDLRKGFSKTFDEIRDGILADYDIRETILNRDYQRLAELNYEKAKEDVKKLEEIERKTGKWRKWTTTGMMFTTGIIGGVAGANLFDYIAGPKVLGGIIEGQTGGSKTGTVGIEEGENWSFETAGKGDSVWTLIEKNLEKNVPEFNGLPKAQQIYIIDHYKDLVAASPGKFGLTDPNLIQRGYGSELEQLFRGPGAAEEFMRSIQSAKGLSPSAMESILNYNAKPSVFYHPEIPSGGGGQNVADLSQVESAPLETIPGGGAAQAPDMMAETAHIPSFAESATYVENMAPEIEETARNFGSFSLLDQEAFLSGPKIHGLSDNVARLNNIPGGATPDQADLLASVNKNWGSMVNTYEENIREFTEAVKKGTGLDSHGVSGLFETKVNEVFDSFKGNDRVLDFVKSINPASEELARHVPLGDVFKSRFVGGGLGESPVYGSTSWIQ